MITDRVMETIKKWDIDVSYKVFKIVPKTVKVRQCLKGLEWSCHGVPWLAGTLIGLYTSPDTLFFRHLLVGLIMDIVYVALMKAYARRRRPSYAPQDDQMTISVDKHSFPSGHASRAIYFATFVGHYYKEWNIVTFFIWIWAIAVTLSRVILGRHHVLDIVAGVILGRIEYFIQFVTGSPINGVLMFLIVKSVGGQFTSTNDFSDSDLHEHFD